MAISHEERIFTVFLQRLKHDHLPLLTKLREKANSGVPLDDFDLAALDHLFNETHEILPKLITCPKYGKALLGAVQCYGEVTALALRNVPEKDQQIFNGK